MGAESGRRPASRWQLLQFRSLPTNLPAAWGVCRKICSPGARSCRNSVSGKDAADGGVKLGRGSAASAVADIDRARAAASQAPGKRVRRGFIAWSRCGGLRGQLLGGLGQAGVVGRHGIDLGVGQAGGHGGHQAQRAGRALALAPGAQPPGNVGSRLARQRGEVVADADAAGTMALVAGGDILVPGASGGQPGASVGRRAARPIAVAASLSVSRGAGRRRSSGDGLALGGIERLGRGFHDRTDTSAIGHGVQLFGQVLGAQAGQSRETGGGIAFSRRQAGGRAIGALGADLAPWARRAYRPAPRAGRPAPGRRPGVVPR